MNALLRGESLGKSFRKRRVLNGAYFEAMPNSITGVIGRNGSGKTTLLQILAGWIPPDQGYVEFQGERIASAGDLARLSMFYLPVDQSILSPRFSVAEHCDALEWRYPCRDREEVFELLGLEQRSLTPVAAMSGGERRRCEIALALIRRPLCLILDEPFRGIDPREAERISGVLRSAAQTGMAVVVSGHERTWVLDCADQVVWVRESSTELLGTPAEARSSWRFQQQYLGP